MLNRRSLIRAYTYALALAFVTSAIAFTATSEAKMLKTAADIAEERAFNELASNADAMATELERATLSASPNMINSILSKAYAHSAAAVTAISSLPDSSTSLSGTTEYISKCGDFALYLARNAAAGVKPSESDMSSLKAFVKNASAMANELRSAAERLRNGEICVGAVCEDENTTDVTLGGTLKRIEAAALGYSGANYDGQFSEHLKNLTAKFTEGKFITNEDEVLELCESFTGVSRDKFTVELVENAAVPVYTASADGVFLEITKTGGYIKSCVFSRPVEYARYSAEDAIAKAEEYILKVGGLKDMKRTSHSVSENRCTVSFAHCEGGVNCYADAVKVVVALDTLDIVGFYTGDYLMNHTEREITEPTVAQSDAESGLSEGLTVSERGLAMLQTEGKSEKLCHEFSCLDTDGNRRTVFIDGATGLEERIDIWDENENGMSVR